jgi:hypothetical protein
LRRQGYDRKESKEGARGVHNNNKSILNVLSLFLFLILLLLLLFVLLFLEISISRLKAILKPSTRHLHMFIFYRPSTSQALNYPSVASRNNPSQKSSTPDMSAYMPTIIETVIAKLTKS